MKKYVAILLAIVLTLSVFSLSVTAGTSGDYTYEVLSESEKTCVITSYTGKTRNLTIPSYLGGYKVVELGELAFLEAKLLKTLVIPNTVEVIRASAFFGSVDLTTVTIPNSVKVIEQCAFAECTNLGTINFPDSVTFIGRGVLYNTKYMPVIEREGDEAPLPQTESPFDTTDWPNGALYIGKHLIAVDLKKSGSFSVASGTKTIAGEAFYWCDKITSVSIPDSVVTIGEYAFYNCKGLKSIKLPESVTTIARSAFNLCKNLQSVNIPSGVKEIGDWAFTGCKALKSVTIPGTVERIGTGAYCACTALTTVKIESGVKEIGKAAFQECSALSSITIADSVTEIGQIAFGVTKFYNTSTNWKNNALYIGNHLIGVKGSVSGEYTVKEGTKAIAEDAFYNCKSITKVNIPSSVTGISAGTFKKCSALKEITVNSGNSKFSASNGILYNKNQTKLLCCPSNIATTKVTIPGTVTEIEDYAFYNCAGISEVNLPKRLECIGTYAFYNCGKLLKVKIPANVKYMGDWVFKVTDGLVLVVAQGSYAEQYAEKNDIKYEYAGIYLENTVYKVIVETEKSGILPADSQLSVSKSTKEDEVEFSITVKSQGNEVQPNGVATVSIGVTEPSAGGKYKVYSVVNGTKTEIPATYEDGYLVFETNKLGDFVVVLEKAAFILGDSNGDGKVSAIDARWVLQVAAGSREATEEERARMDANGSGTITAIDARWILQAVAGAREL